MGKGSAGRFGQAPVVIGVVASRPGAVRRARVSLEGVGIVTDAKQLRQVINLFIRSAETAGEPPPSGIQFMAGEIFYENGGIAEVRLAGMMPPRKSGQHITKKTWTTKKEPQFDLAGFGIVPSPSDLGRTFVAVLKSQKILIIAWNVKANEAHRGSSDQPAGGRLLRVTDLADEEDEGLGHSGEAQYEVALSYAEFIIDSVRKLRDVLVQLRDRTYSEELKYMSPFSYAFKPLLELRGVRRRSDGALEPYFTIKQLEPRELEKGLLEAASDSARGSLGRRLGRRPGSRNKKSPADKTKKIVELKKRLVRAIGTEYREAVRAVGIDRAEGKTITKTSVAKRLKVSRAALDKQLKRGGLDFQELIREALRVLKKKFG